MIIEATPFLGGCGLLVIGFIGALVKGIVGVGKTIFGGSSKTSPNASYENFLQKQEASNRAFEQRMLLLQQAQQKPTGMTISPLMIFGGIAVVAMVFLPKMMGGR